MSCDMSCEEGTGFRPDGAGGVAMALRALESPDWPQLTRAVLGRNGTRPEVVGKLADLLEGGAHAPILTDYDGVPIAVGDTVWAKRDGRRWTVVGFDFSKWHSVIAVDEQCTKKELKTGWLTHTEPDSWERLEKNALKGVCEYAGAERKPGTIDSHECGGCRFDEDGDGPTCEKQMALDLVRRAKALAGVEVAE